MKPYVTDFKKMVDCKRLGVEPRTGPDLITTVLDTLGSLVVVLDRQGRIVGFNRMCEQATGYAFAEVAGRHVWDFLLLPEEVEAVKAVFVSLAAGQFPNRYENYWVARDGQRRMISWSNNALTDASGAVECVIATGIDITEQKRIMAELSRTRERLETAIAASDLGLWEYDIKAGRGFIDPVWASRFGYELQEIDSDMAIFKELVHHDDAAKVMQELDEHLAGHRPYFEAVFRLRTKAGTWRWIVSRGQIVARDKSGNPLRIIGTHKDITEQKKMELKLRQSQKMEAIGVLAGGIAHDFNNILGAIFGYTELSLLDVPRESRAHRNLSQVINAARRAADLVKQILTISRQTEQERIPISLQPVLKETLKLLRGTLPTTIEITQDIDSDCRPVLADATQIHQVLMNLCTNSCHAMRQHGGVLSVAFRELRADSALVGRHPELVENSVYAYLAVRDTGHGMDKATLERIFEPYFTTKKAGEGTGLGMAIVHSIIKAHDGVISVKSAKGKGTTVEIFFPVLLDHELVRQIIENESSLPRVAARVLFVDDEEPIREVGQYILKRLGCKVEVVNSGLEALQMFRADPMGFDLVITDQTMPAMTGYELAKELLRLRPELPIILITGFSEAVNEEKVKALGIREYVMKPLSIRALSHALSRAIH